MHLGLCFFLAGLGDYQAGTKQYRHLLGSHNESRAAYRIPAQEEAARAEERSEFEERIGCCHTTCMQLLLDLQ